MGPSSDARPELVGHDAAEARLHAGRRAVAVEAVLHADHAAAAEPHAVHERRELLTSGEPGEVGHEQHRAALQGRQRRLRARSVAEGRAAHALVGMLGLDAPAVLRRVGAAHAELVSDRRFRLPVGAKPGVQDR